VDGGDDEVNAALAAARAALDSIRSRYDDPEKFRAVSELAEGFRALSEDASAERGQVVSRIRDRDQLKLAPLAKEVGMSTTRLHQLIAAAMKETRSV
jgi:hypothetical protein